MKLLHISRTRSGRIEVRRAAKSTVAERAECSRHLGSFRVDSMRRRHRFSRLVDKCSPEEMVELEAWVIDNEAGLVNQAIRPDFELSLTMLASFEDWLKLHRMQLDPAQSWKLRDAISALQRLVPDDGIDDHQMAAGSVSTSCWPDQAENIERAVDPVSFAFDAHGPANSLTISASSSIEERLSISDRVSFDDETSVVVEPFLESEVERRISDDPTLTISTSCTTNDRALACDIGPTSASSNDLELVIDHEVAPSHPKNSFEIDACSPTLTLSRANDSTTATPDLETDAAPDGEYQLVADVRPVMTNVYSIATPIDIDIDQLANEAATFAPSGNEDNPSLPS